MDSTFEKPEIASKSFKVGKVTKKGKEENKEEKKKREEGGKEKRKGGRKERKKKEEETVHDAFPYYRLLNVGQT